MKSSIITAITLCVTLSATAPAFAQLGLERPERVSTTMSGTPDGFTREGSEQVSTTMAGNPEGFTRERSERVQTSMSGNPEG